jgi:microcystin-dependent protein
MAVGGALAELTHVHNWEQFGTMTPEESAEAATELYFNWSTSDMCLIGSILPFATIDPPANALICDGSYHLRVDYPILYQRLDPTFIIDGDYFQTPNLTGKFPLGEDLDHPIGQMGGAFEHTQTIAEMASHSHYSPPHGHSDTPHTHAEGIAVPSAADLGTGVPVPSAVPSVGITGPASVGIIPTEVSIENTGGDTPMDITPPYIAVRYCIIAR